MKLNLLLLLVFLGLLCYEPALSQPVENTRTRRSPQDEGAESTTPVWCNFSSPFRSVGNDGEKLFRRNFQGNLLNIPKTKATRIIMPLKRYYVYIVDVI